MAEPVTTDLASTSVSSHKIHKVNIICSCNVLVRYQRLFPFSVSTERDSLQHQTDSYIPKGIFLLDETVHTAPNGISYSTERLIQHQTDSLPHKTVHTAPNGTFYWTRRCIRHQTGFLTLFPFRTTAHISKTFPMDGVGLRQFISLSTH
jgi:hypothetical protein